MREKKEVVVISFKNIDYALRLEELIKDRKFLGRVIPTPSSISASCGFSFRLDKQYEQEILEILSSNSIEYEALHYLMMY